MLSSQTGVISSPVHLLCNYYWHTSCSTFSGAILALIILKSTKMSWLYTNGLIVHNFLELNPMAWTSSVDGMQTVNTNLF